MQQRRGCRGSIQLQTTASASCTGAEDKLSPRSGRATVRAISKSSQKWRSWSHTSPKSTVWHRGRELAARVGPSDSEPAGASALMRGWTVTHLEAMSPVDDASLATVYHKADLCCLAYIRWNPSNPHWTGQSLCHKGTRDPARISRGCCQLLETGVERFTEVPILVESWHGVGRD